ncbi:MAG: hypothetical protein M3Q36_03950, partial [bacterium]|nr:hypothetical protein [bacterium]
CKKFRNGVQDSYCERPEYTPLSNTILVIGLASVVVVLLTGTKIARGESPIVVKKSAIKKSKSNRRKK